MPENITGEKLAFISNYNVQIYILFPETAFVDTQTTFNRRNNNTINKASKRIQRCTINLLC